MLVKFTTGFEAANKPFKETHVLLELIYHML